MGGSGDRLTALLREFRDADDLLDVSWVRVATALLSFCREHQPDADGWRLLGGEPFVTIKASRIILSAALRRAGGVRLAADEPVSGFADRDSLAGLHDAVVAELEAAMDTWVAREGRPDMLPVVLARAAANAIDEVYGHTFVEWFRGEGELTITDGRPYPAATRNPKRWMGGFDPNSRPTNLPSRDLAATWRLRLGTRTELSYVLDFDSWNRLAPLGGGDRMELAVGQPNLYLGEFDIRHPADEEVYYNRGPRDSDRQFQLVMAQVEEAGRRGVDVLVLPEYCLDQDACDRLHDAFRELVVRPKLVVAGLVETDEDGALEDKAWFCVLGPWPVAPHSLVVPAKVSGAPVDGRQEGIRSGSEIRVFFGDHLTVAVLICRDAFDETILHQLADVGVNLLLVPAMSPKTASMVELTGPLRTRSQAFVALANGPAHWAEGPTENGLVRGSVVGRSEGLFSGPYALANAHVHLPEASPAEPPTPSIPAARARGLWSFNTATRVVRWFEPGGNG